MRLPVAAFAICVVLPAFVTGCSGSGSTPGPVVTVGPRDNPTPTPVGMTPTPVGMTPTPQPTVTPTLAPGQSPMPTGTPTIQPTITPTPIMLPPTPTPLATMSPIGATPAPTATPTVQASVTPQPTVTPTPKPTATPVMFQSPSPSPTPVTTKSPTPAPSVSPSPAASVAFNNYYNYGYDIAHSGYNPNSAGITPASIASSALHLAWQVAVPGGGNQAQPLLVTNVGTHSALLIVVSGLNIEAYDGQTGTQVWSTPLGGQYFGGNGSASCGEGGVAGTPAYVASLGSLFAAAGNNDTNPNHVIISKIDVATGAVSTTLDITPTLQTGETTASHTGMLYANGKLYLGTGSNCEGANSWAGRLVEVDPSAMTVTNTFFTTFGVGGNDYGGGGIWSWGGPAADGNGNVYVATGNAETPNSAGASTIQPPFVSTSNEAAGYAEHMIKLSSSLSVEDSNAPSFNFNQGYADLDFSGTPVLFQPTGCDQLVGTQGKGGVLVIHDTTNLSTPQEFEFSTPAGLANYIGNPAYSPNTQLLYAPIAGEAANDATMEMYSPGLAAIQVACPGGTASILWHDVFGPNSFNYSGTTPRSAPAVTSGGVVLEGTPCTSNGSGGCTAGSGTAAGAEWAIDASTGNVLNGGLPLFQTAANIRMPATVDGNWMYVMDNSGNLYALTVDPSVQAVRFRRGVITTPRARYPN